MLHGSHHAEPPVPARSCQCHPHPLHAACTRHHSLAWAAPHRPSVQLTSRYCSRAAGRVGCRYTPPVRCAACCRNVELPSPSLQQSMATSLRCSVVGAWAVQMVWGAGRRQQLPVF